MASRKSRKKNNLLFLYFFVFTESISLKGQNLSFPVGMVSNDEQAIRFMWGVKSLPRLILMDKRHVVQAEGLGVEEIVDKIKNIKQ